MRWAAWFCVIGVALIAALGSEAQGPAQTKERKDVRFFAASDPQYGYYAEWVRAQRTEPTFREAAQMLARCVDCAKVFVIAGDLSHDDPGETWKYGSDHKKAEELGVKVFDGLGNHDGDRFEQDWVSFVSERGLYHYGVLKWQDPRTDATAEEKFTGEALAPIVGWKVYDYLQSKIEAGELTDPTYRDDQCDNKKRERDCKTRSDNRVCGTFRFADSYYCNNSAAYYYSFALYPFGGAPQPSVYLVQLHNALYSATAVAYLQRFKDKLAADGELDAPVILVAHQVDGSASVQFATLVQSMNVAAVIVGHYGCRDKNTGGRKMVEGGHCDGANTLDDLTGFNGDPFPVNFMNKHGAKPFTVNVDGMMQNIFWSVEVSPSRRKIAFHRFDRGEMSAYTGDPKGNLFKSMLDAAFQTSPAGFNLPSRSRDPLVCDWTLNHGDCKVEPF